MRYILDDSGYIDSVSCTPFNCKDKSCKEYTGSIPSGYNTLQEWAQKANIRAYKIVNSNLTYDATKAAELEAEWAMQTGSKIYRGSLSTSGWYRAARYSHSGGLATSFILNINTWFNHSNNMSAMLCVNIAQNTAKVTALSCLKNNNVVSKVRVVKENDECYVEIYYNHDLQNVVAIDILDQDVWKTNNSKVVVSVMKFEAATSSATVLTTQDI